jgi:hypothetical protein
MSGTNISRWEKGIVLPARDIKFAVKEIRVGAPPFVAVNRPTMNGDGASIACASPRGIFGT